MKKYDYKKLRPFCRFVLENFPFIEYDFDALTPWKMWCALGNQINKIINSQNDLGEEVENLSNAFISLQEYIENYFENLDVQDEIDNKLDEMAENGELANIIENLLMEGKIIFPKNYNNYIKSDDFCFIKTPSKVVMIDTGRSENWSYLVECMSKFNITHIDVLIITHFHGDHIGNFSNLCSGHYLDENSTVYAQSNESGWDITSQYNMFISCVNTYHLTYIVPSEENQIVQIDSLCKIKFNNITPSYWLTHPNGNGTFDYNDTSFILSIYYGSIKFLNGGDAGLMPFLKMIEDGYINESYNLFKIEHHAINNTGNALTLDILKIINPEYTVQTSSLFETIDTIDNQASNRFQDVLGFKNIVTGYNNDFVYFNVSQNSLTLGNGNSMQTAFGNDLTLDLYIDISTTKDIMNGSQEYPFKTLNQCLANLNPNIRGSINIHLADGIYNDIFNTSNVNNKSISRIVSYKSIINIIGNQEDNTKVILKNGFIIKNSNVRIQYLTITNYDNHRAVDCYNSNIRINNCILKTLEETNTANCLFFTNTNASVDGCNISHYTTGISNYFSNVTICNNTVDNCTHFIYNKQSTIRYYNNTVTNTTDIVNSDYQSNQSFIDGFPIYSDNTGSSSVAVDSSINLNNFRYFEIAISDGSNVSVYKTKRDKNYSAISFSNLNSAGTILYNKGCIISRNNNNFNLTRMFQSQTTLSSGNTTYNTEFTGLKIVEIKGY